MRDKPNEGQTNEGQISPLSPIGRERGWGWPLNGRTWLGEHLTGEKGPKEREKKKESVAILDGLFPLSSPLVTPLTEKS